MVKLSFVGTLWRAWYIDTSPDFWTSRRIQESEATLVSRAVAAKIIERLPIDQRQAAFDGGKVRFEMHETGPVQQLIDFQEAV